VNVQSSSTIINRQEGKRKKQNPASRSSQPTHLSKPYPVRKRNKYNLSPPLPSTSLMTTHSQAKRGVAGNLTAINAKKHVFVEINHS
jgi:hypothetical protein